MSRTVPEVPTYDYALFGEVQARPLSRVRQVIANRLAASWATVPHVHQFDDVDLSAFEDLHGELAPIADQFGGRITLLPFVMKACALALKAFPEVNASLDAACENLVLKQYCHIAFAAQTPIGLLAPVIRNVDALSVPEVSAAVRSLASKARAGKLQMSEAEGACFTVSNLGELGGTGFTPVINAPELAILSVARAQSRVVAVDGAFVSRTMLPLCLAYDHRVIDGALGARFLAHVRDALQDPRSLCPDTLLDR